MKEGKVRSVTYTQRDSSMNIKLVEKHGDRELMSWAV
jgi:hypothetical protein